MWDLLSTITWLQIVKWVIRKQGRNRILFVGKRLKYIQDKYLNLGQ